MTRVSYALLGLWLATLMGMLFYTPSARGQQPQPPPNPCMRIDYDSIGRSQRPMLYPTEPMAPYLDRNRVRLRTRV